jgi:hypothetical protein
MDRSRLQGCASAARDLETPKGTIELELYAGDAPFGVEHFMRVVESGDIVGTEFTRLVPNFVAQQQAIRNASTLRDEVTARGLTRGNLSWASAGLGHRPARLHTGQHNRSPTTKATSPRSAAWCAAWTSSIGSSSATKSRRQESSQSSPCPHHSVRGGWPH